MWQGENPSACSGGTETILYYTEKAKTQDGVTRIGLNHKTGDENTSQVGARNKRTR